MPNPWLQVPIADYEAHMALPSVAQSQLLATALQRIVTRFQPRSLAILGVAGGNGLEQVDSARVRRVVALDVNPDYLAVCTSRHAASFAEFQPVLHDLSQGPPSIEPVDCVFAGLLLEYLDVQAFCGSLPSMLAPDGVFATVLQLPSPELPVVSESPFTSLRLLESQFHFVDPSGLDHALSARGMQFVHREDIRLVSGKAFSFAVWQIGASHAIHREQSLAHRKQHDGN